MKRICVIGDSHLASLKVAWVSGLAERYPSVNLTFFGAGGNGIGRVVAREGRLVTTEPHVIHSFTITSEVDPPEVVLHHYDAIFVHGLFPMSLAILDLLRIEESSSRTRQHFSSALRNRVISHRLETGLAGHLIRQIRKVSQLPVYFSPHACFCETLLGMVSRHECDAFHRMMGPLELSVLDSIEAELVRTISHNQGFYLAQPRATLTEKCFTRAEYLNGAVRMTSGFSEAQPDDDFTHMNPQYGSQLLEMLFSALG